MSDPVPPSTSQSGLSEKAAGGLAYVTLIPAVIFLLVDPYRKSTYIRFHSWQCIFMALTWLAIDLAIGTLAMVLSFLHLFSYALYPLVALGMLILWLVVLIKAFNGEKLKLPVIGDLAERQAAI